jgi:tetratricopeptide (TPR) repeat protein
MKDTGHPVWQEMKALKARIGLTYQDIVNNLLDHANKVSSRERPPYHDEASLKKVFNSRVAKRPRLLYILIWGMAATEKEINQILATANYGTLRAMEIESLPLNARTGLPSDHEGGPIHSNRYRDRERGLNPKTERAYEKFKKARKQWNIRTPATIEKSGKEFDSSFPYDPNFILTLTAKAKVEIMKVAHGTTPPTVGLPHAMELAEEAHDVNPHCGEAFACLAWYAISFKKDWRSAQDLLDKAEKFSPHDPFIHNARAYFCITQKDLAGTLAAFDEGLALEPSSLPMQALRVEAYYFGGKPDEAVKAGIEFSKKSPNFLLGRTAAGFAYEVAGKHAEAIREHEAALEISKGASLYVGFLGYALATAGKAAAARKWLDELKQRSAEKFVPQYSIALINIALKNYDDAMSYLEEGYTEYDHWLSFARVDPHLNALRNSKRFQRLIDRFEFCDRA